MTYKQKKEEFIKRVHDFYKEDHTYEEWVIFRYYMKKNVYRYGLIKEFEKEGLFKYNKKGGEYWK